MKKPTETQMKQALAEAETLREGEDAHHLGHTLLYLAHRCEYLEKVQVAAERYVQFGLGEAEHSRLVKAIERARHEEEQEEGGEETDLGL